MAGLLAVVFALAAVALIVLSRPQFPPRLGDLAVIEGAFRDRSFGLSGTTLRIVTARTERQVQAAGCADFLGDLRAGDQVTVWVDQRARAWRVMRGAKPLCTYLQAIGAAEASRHIRRIVALVLAAAGVVCAGVAIRGRLQRG